MRGPSTGVVQSDDDGDARREGRGGSARLARRRSIDAKARARQSTLRVASPDPSGRRRHAGAALRRDARGPCNDIAHASNLGRQRSGALPCPFRGRPPIRLASAARTVVAWQPRPRLHGSGTVSRHAGSSRVRIARLPLRHGESEAMEQAASARIGFPNHASRACGRVDATARDDHGVGPEAGAAARQVAAGGDRLPYGRLPSKRARSARGWGRAADWGIDARGTP